MQRTLTTLSDYGRSGGLLVVNPTDRGIGAYSVSAVALNPRTARYQPVVRGTAPSYTAPGALPASTATVTVLTPNTAAAGGGYILLVVTGTGFTPSTLITVDGRTVATTYVSATSLRTPVFLLPATPKTVAVGVQKPGEAISGTQTFTVT